MAEVVKLPIPFWIAQFQLLGGSKRFLLMTGGYTGIFILGVFGWCRGMRYQPLAVTISDIFNLLTVLQIGLMLFGGANAIYRGILRDHRTKMLESHRIAPISNIGVVLGYMFGSTTQILGLCMVNLVGGIALNMLVAAPVGEWILGNGLLLSTSLMIWALAVLLGMRPTKPMSPAPVLVLGGVLATPLFFVLPGGAVITGGYATFLAYGVMFGKAGPTPTLPAAVFVTIVVTNFVWGLMWLMLAAAKYRRPDLPFFNARRGLMLLALWLLTAFGSLDAVVKLSMNSPIFGRVIEPEFIPMPWIGTLTVTLIVAGIAIAGAVDTRRLICNGSQPRDRWDRMSGILVACLSILLFAGLSFGASVPIAQDLVRALGWAEDQAAAETIRSWLTTAGAMALALLSLWAVARIAQLRPKSSPVIIGLYMLVAWGFPSIVEFVRTMVGNELNSKDLQFGPLMGLSPVGTFIGAWSGIPVRVMPGLIAQGIILFLLFILAASTRKRLRVST
ncbi:MAG: hypothetical protein AABZ47_18975 [Planctomycetota bacterium]